jgi:hypothetical protein
MQKISSHLRHLNLRVQYQQRCKVSVSHLQSFMAANQGLRRLTKLTPIRACVMRFGMNLWCGWRTDTIRFTTKVPRAKRGDWLRCGAHRQRDGQPCRARVLDSGRCKYDGKLSTGPKTPQGNARAVANLKQSRTSAGICFRRAVTQWSYCRLSTTKGGTFDGICACKAR